MNFTVRKPQFYSFACCLAKPHLMNMLLERTTSPKLQGRRRLEMKIGGHIDYHGSRTYAPDLPSVVPGRWLKRLAGPLTDWPKHLLEMLLKPGAREAAETVWLVHGDERHFSVLGSDRGEKRRRAAGSPWPEGKARFRRPLGHRADND